jgi:hypothetical protein
MKTFRQASWVYLLSTKRENMVVIVIQGVWEQGTEESIWTEEGSSDGRVEITAQRGSAWFVLFTKYNRIIKSRRMRWVGHVAWMGKERSVYRLLVGKPEGKRPLRWPRHRWVDNIKMDLVEKGWGGVGWIGLAQDRDRWKPLVNVVTDLQVLWNSEKLSSGYTTGVLSRSAQLHSVSYSYYYSVHSGIKELSRELKG